ncbi:MAG: FAD-dependent monooxygenase [Hyphomicrobiales bacterium]|nr:FAD-dependent monooxygenase [Hyphomicrobiales bacterium]
MSDRPIIIAGAGVGGLAAALALSDAGRYVVVLERAPALAEFGAGLQLGPNATRRLARWGALDRLRETATAPEAVDIRSSRDASVIATAPVGESEKRWGAPYFVSHRADLLSALVETATARPNIEIRLGCGLDGWQASADSVTVHVEGRPDIQGAALIGADGLRSRVRDGLGLATPDGPRYSGRTSWRSLLPASSVPADLLRPRTSLWLGAGAHLVLYPLRGASVLNAVAIVQDDWGDLNAPDFWSANGDAAFLASRFQGWAREARDVIETAPGWRRWPLYERKAVPTWSRGRVTVLGDAAHAMAPFLAQGAAQAIEDADALGRAVAAHPADEAAALDAYQRERVQRANKVQRASRIQGLVYHLSGPAGLARDMTMRAIGPAGMAKASDWIYRV